MCPWDTVQCPDAGETDQAIALTTTALCRYWDTGIQDQAGTDTWPLRKCSLLESCRVPTGLAHSALYCRSPESLRPSSPRAKQLSPGSWLQIPHWLSSCQNSGRCLQRPAKCLVGLNTMSVSSSTKCPQTTEFLEIQTSSSPFRSRRHQKASPVPIRGANFRSSKPFPSPALSTQGGWGMSAGRWRVASS